MIRSFVVAFVTIVVVVLFGATDFLAAQQQPAASSPGAVAIQFTGGTQGVNLELFVNAGKVADVTINSSGAGASVLDLSNLGKVQLQVYVDVCQDGKTVRVLVVAGQPIPEGNCKRRIVGAAWWSDCGVTRITLDLTKFGMRVIGCGSFISENRNWLIPVTAGVVAVPFFAGSGGDSTSVSAPITTTGSSTTTGTTTSANPPVATNPPVTMPTNPTVPVVPIDFNVALMPGYIHPGGSTSIACFLIIATAVGSAPALNQSATFSGTITGPGVVSGGTFSGSLSAAGQAAVQAVINSLGVYVGNVTVIFGGVSRQMTAQINVQSPQGTCATAR